MQKLVECAKKKTSKGDDAVVSPKMHSDISYLCLHWVFLIEKQSLNTRRLEANGATNSKNDKYNKKHLDYNERKSRENSQNTVEQKDFLMGFLTIVRVIFCRQLFPPLDTSRVFCEVHPFNPAYEGTTLTFHFGS